MEHKTSWERTELQSESRIQNINTDSELVLVKVLKQSRVMYHSTPGKTADPVDLDCFTL